jgi:hypothetical protein
VAVQVVQMLVQVLRMLLPVVVVVVRLLLVVQQVMVMHRGIQQAPAVAGLEAGGVAGARGRGVAGEVEEMQQGALQLVVLLLGPARSCMCPSLMGRRSKADATDVCQVVLVWCAVCLCIGLPAALSELWDAAVH